MAADASRFVLPASPNWYCSAVADCSLNKIYAFGARNCVYLLDVSSQTPVFDGQLAGHTERVTSVCFSKHKLHANFVASGSDDKTVKMWDAETKLTLLEHKAHSAKITCLAWSPLVTDLVVSGDEKGQVVVWRFAERIVFGGCPVQDHIFSMALSYLTESEIAVGYKSGLIAVLNVSSDGALSIVNKLQGHSSEIHSLTWCPTPQQHIDFGPLQDKTTAAEGHLIVSGSRDQTVRLWDTAQGKVLSIKQLPKRSSQKWKDKHDPHWAKDRLWLGVCWPVASPGHVITSSQGGELLLWDLSKEGKEQCQTFGRGHSRIVFNISCDVAGTRIMTVSMDRQIIIWDPQHLQSLHTLPTLGGFAYSLSISPLDPGTLGVGVGDNMLRVWQTASPVGPYEALTLWQGIKSKVMVVKWHPSKEGLLAFGADDGQVGVYNTISKRAEISATYHKKTVYSLSWGPPCPNTGADGSTTHNLYSCAGDGRVLQHRPGHFMDDPVDVNALILKANDLKHKPFSRTDVSWNLEGTVMALGNEDGSIEVYIPPNLVQVGMVITHKKSITTLVWHHGYNEITAGDVVSCKCWLASGSNESTIHVHDLSSVLGDSPGPRPRSAPITECFRQLSGHSGRVTGLSWSPHQSELLLSSSYDGTAQVWNVLKGEPLYNFRGHSSRVMCVVWSYLDPDLVYSGGEDGTVRPWRQSIQQNRQPPVPGKKMAHSASKSSKSKKAKQKAKGKVESIDNGSWREEREPKQESNVGNNAQTPDKSSDKSKETELNSCEGTEIQPRVDTPGSEKKGIIQLQDADESAEKGSVIETVEENEDKSGPVEKAEAVTFVGNTDVNLVGSEGVNLADGYESEKKTTAVVVQSQPVMPLRSRVSLEPCSSSSSSKKKKKVKSMFPLSAVADNKSKAVTQEECVELTRILYGQAGDSSSQSTSPHGEAGSDGLVNLGLFADRRAAYRMLATEGQHHRENGNLDYRLQLEIWKGNLGGALEMATNSKQLTDWLVALSPLGGRDVWLATTRAFADQLASQGAYQRAVLYYLACHDTYKAIEVFRKQAMYREAIALAKVRLSPLDPVLFDLYSAWARKLETENSFEQAAKCYLAVHSSAEAVRVLCRRGDQPSLRTALQVALFCDETEVAISLSLRLMQSYLMTSHWKEARDILIGCPGVEPHILNVCVHELLLVTLIEEQIVSEDTCEDATRTKISSFLKTDTNTGEPWWKYSYMDTPCCDSPWIANNEPGKWFIACVLQAWYDCGVFKAHSTVTLHQTLKAYYESISTGTETISETLFKMSLEIALGLLSALTGDLYAGCQYWLQALSSCNKNCLFAMQRQLCSMLLPDGITSLDNLLKLSHELGSVNASDGTTKGVGLQQLFQHFQAYYCKALLTELWYRLPEALAIFQCDQHESVDETITSRTETEMSCSLGEFEGDLQSESKASKYRNTSGISDSNRINGDEKVGGAIQEGEVCITAVDDENENKASDSKEFLLAKESAIIGKQNLKSTLKNFETVLLSGHHVKLSNLRALLTEIRKAMLLKRSRQFLQAGSAGKHLSQKKKKDKKLKAQTLQLVGFSRSSSEGDPTSEAASGSSSVECTQNSQMEHREDEGALTEESCSLVEALDITGRDESEKRDSGGDEERMNECLAVKGSVGVDNRSEVVTKGLTTPDGRPPIDLRFMTSDTSLEFLEQEEGNVLKELEQFDLKDLSFPSPLESALTMGHFCACSEGLPIPAADLRKVGINVVLWAQNYAQASTDLKGVLRLTQLYSDVNSGKMNIVRQ